jgi:uncharacterized repeat protein (TIGR01451 family)
MTATFSPIPRGWVAALPILFVVLLGQGAPAAAQDLQLEITADRSPVAPGDRVRYAVVVSNTGAVVVTGITVDVQLPSDIVGFRESTTTDVENVRCPGIASDNTCDPGETLVWSPGELEAGENRILLFQPRIRSDAADGVVAMTVAVVANSQSPVNARVEVTIDDGSTTALGLAGETGPVAAGGIYTYRLDYGVLAGSGGAPDAVLQLDLPNSVTFESASNGGVESDGVVTWSLGATNEGDGGEVFVTVVIDGGLDEGTLLLAAATFESGSSGVPDSRADHVVPVHTQEPIEIALTADNVPSVPGERTDFALIVSNTSGLSVSEVKVQLILPDFIASFRESSTTDVENVRCPGNASDNSCDPGEKLVWTPGELAAGESRTFLFEASTSGSATAGELQRLRGLASASLGVQQIFLENYGVDTSPVMTLGLSGDVGPVAAGNLFTYRLDYGALFGSGGATDAELQFDLPDGMTFQSASDDGSESGGVVSWNIGPTNSGDGGEFFVTATVDGALGSGELLLARAALFSGNVGAPAARSYHAVSIHPQSPLRVAFTADNGPSIPGERTDFALTVSNTSGLSVSEVKVQLILPDFIASFRESSTTDVENVRCPGIASDNSCDPGEKLVWTPGELAAGESRTFLFEASTSGSATAGELQRLRGLASASLGVQQIFLENYGVDTSPVMTLGLSGQANPLEAGDLFTYRLNYGVLSGSGGADNVLLQIRLPEEVTFDSTTGAGSESGGVVTWGLGRINSGDGGERSVTVNIDEGLGEGELLLARATLTTGNDAEQVVHASHSAAIGAGPLSVRVASTEPPASPSQPIEYTIEVTNSGVLSVTSTTVQTVLPNFITSFRESSTTDVENVRCPGNASDNSCDPGEKLVWTPGDLGAGETRSLSFGTTTQSNTQQGNLLKLRFAGSADEVQQTSGNIHIPIVEDFTVPVELTSFTASLEGEAVALAWSTATETNNAGFDVERSTDGETFTTIGFELGVGTTEEAQSYRFVDREAPFATTLFYRLRQVDTDGTFEYSPVVEVEVTPSAVALLPVAPNPVSASARLRYELPEATAVRLQVFDLLGRRVATLADGEKPAGRHEVTWTGSRLAPGTYFVRLQAGSTAQTQMLRLVR